MNRPNRQTGFTLIEILVVLVIVAIITAVAVVAFGDFGRGRKEKITVETFGRMIKQAQSQAILKPAVLGLMLTPSGYVFYQWVTEKEKSKWVPMRHSMLSHPNVFADQFKVQMKTVSDYDPADGGENPHPAIVFLPSGYVTAFEVSLKGKAHHFLMTVENNGNVVIKSET